MMRWIIVVGMVFATACAKPQIPPDLTHKTLTYSLSNAQSADSFFQDGNVPFVVKFISTGTGNIEKLIFGDIRLDVTQSRPAILANTADQWLALPFSGELFGQYGWQYVASNHDRTEMFAILDCQIEDPAWRLLILTSSDGGRTWALRSTLRKVCYFAGFHDFVMDRQGKGRLTILLDDDYTHDIKAGLYHYHTTDGCCTWTGPQYEMNYLYERWGGTQERTIYCLEDITE